MTYPHSFLCKKIFFALLILSIQAFYACSSSESRPNIVFIMADDLGYGHLGCYGQEIIQTPNIDRLAAEGMRFTQAYSGCSVCAPSRNALMTGQHSGHISVRGNGGGVSLQAEDTTIAEVLKKAGYATGIFGKWGLGETGTAGTPNKKGFDQFFGYLHQLHAQFYYPEFLWQNEEKIHFPENRRMKRITYAHDLILEKALAFLAENKGRPFFLYIPVTIPHHEFIAPDETLALYSGQFDENPIPHWRDGYALPREPKATFAAMVTHLDKGIGILMNRISELNLAQNTVVFFVSDNGGAKGPLENAEFFKANGSLRDYKGSLYEGGIRIPMIVRWQGRIIPHSTSDLITYFPDIMPTLAQIAEATSYLPDNLDGLSILPTLLQKGSQKFHEALYWEDTEYNREPPYGLITDTEIRAVRMGKWKGIRNMPEAPLEVYNLEADMGENHNLAEKYPQIAEELAEIMQREHQDAPPQVDMTRKEAANKYIPVPN